MNGCVDAYVCLFATREAYLIFREVCMDTIEILEVQELEGPTLVLWRPFEKGDNVR